LAGYVAGIDDFKLLDNSANINRSYIVDRVPDPKIRNLDSRLTGVVVDFDDRIIREGLHACYIQGSVGASRDFERFITDVFESQRNGGFARSPG